MKRIVEVDIMRPIAILLVVFTHCFAIYNGAWKNPDPINIPKVFSYQILTSFLGSFRMPAVVLVAGYIYTYFDEKRGNNLKVLVISKIKRLLIPAFIFGVAYFLLFSEFHWKRLIVEVSSGVGHLWFLPMLFWNFIFGFYLVKISSKKYRFLTLIILFLFSAISGFVPNVLGISKALYFIPYYYIGVLLWKYREGVIERIVRLPIVILLAVIYIITFVMLTIYEQSVEEHSLLVKVILLGIKYFLQTAGVICFYLATMLFVIKAREPRGNRSLIKLSYGIYVFHQFILMFLVYKLHIYRFFDYRVLPFLLFVITIIVSMMTAKLFIRTRVGKFLIG